MNRAPLGFEPLMEQLYNDRAVLRPEGLTTQPHTDLYLSGNFILMCFGNKMKTKQEITKNDLILNSTPENRL